MYLILILEYFNSYNINNETINITDNTRVNMVRPRKVNKLPMTTVALSENLLKEMVKSKKSQESWYDFINRMFHEWCFLRKDYTQLEADISKNYQAQIDFWKRRATELEKEVIQQ